MGNTIFSTMKPIEKKKMLWAIVLSVVFSFIVALFVSFFSVQSRLNEPTQSATENFSAIMDNYTHSFELFSETLREKMKDNETPQQIEDYLKEADSRLALTEGEDFDGLYMYYQGKYIYSWDTPHEVYENSGYVATERPWYTGAKEANGEICFSVPYRSYANSYMLATISQMQEDGETVIAYDIKLGAIEHFASSLTLYQGALTLICDGKANVIGTTNPLYAGGNFLLSDEELQNRVDIALDEQSKASEDEQTKADQKVESEQALQILCGRDRNLLQKTSNFTEKLQIDLARGSLGYSCTYGQYTCFVIIPFTSILPLLFLIWLGVSLLCILALVLVENMIARKENTKEIEKKNTQLAEAVVRADAANVAKSQFLAQMSHEIRTPMNAVIGLTSIAKTEVRSPEKVSDYLNKIEGSSKLLLSIINDVLDMSAIEGGKLKIDKAEFDFKGMLTNITTVFYEQARMKGVSFEVRMNGVTEEKMIGDELRVNQILMNLLSNAVKFTPPNGEIDLMVLQASSSHGKVQIRFSVSDTGCGMSEEMLGRLFRPFEQESASTARKHGGSGLGLSIAKKLTEMMGGSIQVQSTLGKGSVFTVDIPFEVPQSSTKQVQSSGFSSIRTLVVDDDVDSCEYSGILLKRLGVRYECVTSGEDALEKLGEADEQGDPFKLCLIDWKMPGMDGGELTKNIREIFGEDSVIIIVSAYDLNELEASGRAIGTDFFIAKPLFQSTLFNALMKISGGDYTKIDAQKEKTDYDFTGRKVLIAEDVTLNMEVATKLLTMVGIEVTCAEDGKQAVDLFEKSPIGTYDCILMDINMPVMDGYEATKKIRAYGRADAKRIPVYAMTANAFAEDVTAALDAGMNGHIAKPIETKVLYRTLEEAFRLNDEYKGEKHESI